MTTPDATPAGGATAAEAAAATVAAIKDNAQRLGLVWSLRPATVTVSSPDVQAAYDGDSVAIAMTSMVGAVLVDQRVYVLIVPPSGNYITGFVGPAGASDADSDGLNSVSAVFSTASVNFVNMAGVATVTFTKRFDSTRLVLQMHATGYLTGIAATVDIGLLVSGDYVIGTLFYNQLLQHLQISGVLYVPAGVPAGTYVVTARVRVGAGGTFNMDGGDRVSFEIVEKV